MLCQTARDDVIGYHFLWRPKSVRFPAERNTIDARTNPPPARLCMHQCMYAVAVCTACADVEEPFRRVANYPYWSDSRM